MDCRSTTRNPSGTRLILGKDATHVSIMIFASTVRLWYLMQKEYCVSDLAQKMEITESAISHQLRALRIARLAQSHKAGKNVIYSLQDEHIRWILEKTYDHISER